jgi:hypothetical protein
MHGVSHVPEFIGITHDIDGDDALMLDLQGSRLENVAPLDGDEPGQAVDKAIAHEARPAHGIDRRERREQPHDVIEPGGRRLSSRRLAAAIGVEGDVRREQRAQARPDADMLLRFVHALRGNRPRIAISTVTANSGIAATTNMSRPRNPNASGAPPIRGPAIAPARPKPSAQHAPVERMAGG